MSVLLCICYSAKVNAQLQGNGLFSEEAALFSYDLPVDPFSGALPSDYSHPVLRAGVEGDGGGPGDKTGGEENQQQSVDSPVSEGMFILFLLAVGYGIHARRKCVRQ